MTYFGDHEGLDLARMWDVGTNTQVDHGATAIDGGGSTIRDLGLDEMLLVFVVLKGRHQERHFMAKPLLDPPQTSSTASP